MAMVTLGRAARLAGICVLVLAAAARSPAATLPCSADDLIALDPACPPSSAPCTIALSAHLGEDCTLDFGPRALTIAGNVIGSGKLTVRAGSLVVSPTGALRAVPGGPLGNHDPTLQITSDGDVWVQADDRYTRGEIEVVGGDGNITLYFDAAGAFTLDGDLRGEADTPGLPGAVMFINAHAGVTMSSTGRVSTRGGRINEYGYAGADGFISVSTAGSVVLDGRVDMLGEGDVSEEDSLIIEAEGEVHLGGEVHLDGYYERTGGGGLRVAAGSGITVGGEITALPGPSTLADEEGAWPGEVLLSAASGDVIIGGSIRVDGALYGKAGPIYICTGCDEYGSPASPAGSVIVTGTLSARQNRVHNDYGPGIITVVGADVSLEGTVDIQNEGQLEIRASRMAHLGGVVHGRVSLLDGRWFGGDGSRIHISAFPGFNDADQVAQAGTVLVDGDLDLSTSGCDQGYCATPFEVRLEGCEARVADVASIDMRGPMGGSLSLEAMAVHLNGDIDVRGDSQDGLIAVTAPFRGQFLYCPPSLEATCDIGSQPKPAVKRSGICACTGDCNGDGVVDAEEIATILDLINLCDGDRYGTACPVVQQSCINADPDNDSISPRDLQRALACAAGGP